MPPRARSRRQISDSEDDDFEPDQPSVEQQIPDEASDNVQESIDQEIISVLETNSRSMTNLFRCFTGFCAEADVTDSALNCDRFLRAYEAATFDCAVVMTGVNLVPATNSTDRLYRAIDQFEENDNPVLGLLDVKSFQWKAMYETRADVNLPSKLHNAVIYLTEEQLDKCEALIVTSASDPDWVAFLPRGYFRRPVRDQRRRNLYGGCTHPTLGHMSPLPPAYAPFVMHRDQHLPEALQNLADRLADPTVEL